MFGKLLCVLFFGCLINCAVIRDDLFRLDIVHYNDFHARFEETTVDLPVCLSNNTDCIGGFARVYQEIMALLTEKPDALLLNAGDVFQGTYWYTLLKWDISQKFINMLPNDAHAIGNHEFDDGVAGLVPYLAALRAPVVAANIDTSHEPTMNGLYNSSIVVKRKGKKIGIIGLITVDTATTSNPAGVIFLDPFETVKREAEKLTKQGVDIIIVLSHCGLDVDKLLAEDVGDNIDVIVGGHSHSLLWNGPSPSHEEVSGPYPIIAESKNKPGHKILIVTAASFSKYLGNVTTYFDKRGELVSFDGEPIFLNRSIPEDPEILELLRPYKEKLYGLVNEVVGFSNSDLLGKDCGAKECGIGDLTADSFLHAAKEKNISNLPQVSFLLRNMIRGSLKKGEITRGAVINTLPISNKIVSMVLAGKYLIEALEHCLTIHWTLHPFNGPWMPQISGFRLTLNSTSGQATVLVENSDDYTPLNPQQEYQVITVEFLAKGSNGFEMLKNGRNRTFVGKDYEILEDYIRKISPFNVTLDNRLNVVS